ncbi:hypothetical protein AB5I41_24035 [Sphingomonas sp. MMS24-JH45]
MEPVLPDPRRPPRARQRQSADRAPRAVRGQERRPPAGQRPVQRRRAPARRCVRGVAERLLPARPQRLHQSVRHAAEQRSGGCCNTAPVIPFGYQNVLIGFDGLDTRYKAIFFTLDKNYTPSSGWARHRLYARQGRAERRRPVQPR